MRTLSSTAGFFFFGGSAFLGGMVTVELEGLEVKKNVKYALEEAESLVGKRRR